MSSSKPSEPVSKALAMSTHPSRGRRPVRLAVSLLRALVVVLWLFVWIVPIGAALELSSEWAALALAILASAFIWWTVVRPLRSRPRVVASHRLRPWRQYAGWLTLAAAAEVALIFSTLVLHEQLAEWRFLPKLPIEPELIPPHFSTKFLGVIAMILAVVVVTPLAEEFTFRGRMQSRLEREIGVVSAIVIPAVIFSALHGVRVAPHHLPFALFVGWVVWRTGSIWAAVYMHALNNAVALTAMYITPGWAIFSEDAPSWLWPYAIPTGVIALCVVLVAGVRINRIAQRSRPHRRARPGKPLSIRAVSPVLPG